MRLIIGCLVIWICSCNGVQTKTGTSEMQTPKQVVDSQVDTSFNLERITDTRDGETYAIVTIGDQTWMAENLRFKAPGSMVNPNFPSKEYGRLYDGVSAQKACPNGWHLPTDLEWNELETTLGMPLADAHKTGWRGEHGTGMKSITGWKEEGNGTNTSGFNGLPAGYYINGDLDGGFGRSVGYWGAENAGSSWIRFLGGPLSGVNRMVGDLSDGLACRCLKD